MTTIHLYQSPNLYRPIYLYQPKRRLTELIKDLSARDLQHATQTIKKIRQQKQRRRKETYSLSSHQILQPSFKPIKYDKAQFSTCTPVSTHQIYQTQKTKAKFILPDRVYCRLPNVKSGSVTLPKKLSLQEESQVIINAKFEQYDRIIDNESGKQKRKRLMQGYQIKLRPRAWEKSKYMRMKTTLFQKFIPDKYHFYNNPLKPIKNCSPESSALVRSRSITTVQPKDVSFQKHIPKKQDGYQKPVQVITSRLSPIKDQRQHKVYNHTTITLKNIQNQYK